MDKARLRSGIQEMREWLEDNTGEEVTDQEAYDAMQAECGLQPDGTCLHAGSEHCDWDCPFGDD